jgi:hypothetical protein
MKGPLAGDGKKCKTLLKEESSVRPECGTVKPKSCKPLFLRGLPLFLSLSVAFSWVGFTHCPTGSHISLSLPSLPQHLGALSGTMHFTLKMGDSKIL